MGFPIGLILGAAGLVLLHEEKYLSNVIQAFGITMGIALTTGIVGLLYGLFFLSVKPASFFHSNGWFIPEGLVDFKNFIAVGSMHNFSYVGGLSGLIAGVAFLVIKRSKTNEETL